MSFETMDWYAEAQQIMAAFNLTNQCIFVRTPDRRTYYLINRSSRHGGHEVFISDSWELRVDYDKSQRVIGLAKEKSYTAISLGWDGAAAAHIGEAAMVQPLAKALFYLGLLTPEVEEALRISVTSHEKTEWLLEK